MNTQIIITPAGVLWVAGAIVSISAAAGVLIRIYKHFRKPGETQDHRIAELAAGAHVGVTLPAKPLSSVGPRQQDPPFPTLPAPMLASPCWQSLNPSSSHANKARPFPRYRRPCWRRPPGKAFVFRRATPTGRPESRLAPAHVGVALPAKPLSSVGPRQQAPPFLALPAPMLASPCRQSLNPSSGHANKACPFPRCRSPCWRHPPGKALIHRRVTPTRPSGNPFGE